MNLPKPNSCGVGLIGVSAGVLGLLGVALGAFGAHVLQDALKAREMTGVWDTAVKYQLIHAVALLALAGHQRVGNGEPGTGQKLICRAAGCWTVGVVLFSGSLYLLALGGPRWIGPVTPLGGLALMAGWVLFILASWRDWKAG